MAVLPELHAADLGAGLVLTYHYWPTSVDKHIFECTLYFVPPRNARERLAQELAAVTFKEYALQDANTLEATQTMIGTRAVKEFLLCDQEVLIRHLHKTTGDYVRSTKAMALPSEFAALEPYLDWDLATDPSATPSGWLRRWPRCRRSTMSHSRC